MNNLITIILRSYKKDYKVDVYKQFRKCFDKNKWVAIDVLLIINNSYAIIIEDKINTNESNEQIKRYKDGLIKLSKIKNFSARYNILELKEENILTCYYKMFEEPVSVTNNIKIKVNKTFNRSNMLTLLNKFKEVNKYQYLYDYYKYLQEMDACLENKENKKIKITESSELLTIKDIRQILYCDFINTLNNDNDCGKSPSGPNTTYWRNIKLNIKSSLGEGFFEKINFYDTDRVPTLKIRVSTIYNEEKRKKLSEDIEKKLSHLNLKKLKLGSDANHEYTLLNYNISEFTFRELKELVQKIQEILNGEL